MRYWDEEGGAAFPCSSELIESGMSLRDWFAGQALANILFNKPREWTWATVAHEAYGYADAMLKARETEQ